MAELSFGAAIGKSDIDAALAYVGKRSRRRGEEFEGVGVALFSVMFVVAEGLVECGLPLDQVESMFYQFKRQVSTQIAAKEARQ